jgi:predicted amidohydrolase YtcJ
MIGHDKNAAVNPYNPFLGMWTSVTRRTKAGGVVWPDQRVGREEALRPYTIHGAWLTKEEKIKGSIEAGKVADFVVIDRDYMTCPEDEIGRIEPLSVYVEGREVWKRP